MTMTNYYIFDDWKPQPILLILFYLFYSYIILFELNVRGAIFVTISFLLFAYAVRFSSKKKKMKK